MGSFCLNYFMNVFKLFDQLNLFFFFFFKSNGFIPNYASCMACLKWTHTHTQKKVNDSFSNLITKKYTVDKIHIDCILIGSLSSEALCKVRPDMQSLVQSVKTLLLLCYSNSKWFPCQIFKQLKMEETKQASHRGCDRQKQMTKNQTHASE